MKQILIFIAVVLFVLNAGAQSRTLTVSSTGTVTTPSQNIAIEKDTVRVVMLLCDTTIKRSVVMWMSGYQIIEQPHYHNPMLPMWYYENEKYSGPEYLNQFKQPLDKKYIVWMVKEIK